MLIYAPKILFLQQWNMITVNSESTSNGANGNGPLP